MKNNIAKDTLNIKEPGFSGWFLFICLIIISLSSQFAQAALWIGKYSGERDEYVLYRQGKILKVEAETLLQPGDKLTVISKTGTLHIWKDDDDSEIILNKKNPSYIVPNSSVPSGLIGNLSTMFKNWMSDTAAEKVKTTSMSTRGDAPVLLLGASDWKNLLPKGLTSLSIYWSGGQPPYKIHLVDDNDKVIAKRGGIHENNITLNDLDLPIGEYGLRVLGKTSTSYIELEVIGVDSLPPLYTKILNSRIPETIKNKYAVLALASHSDWLFHSLQLSEQYNLKGIKQKILKRDVPKPVNETQLN